MKFFNCDYCSLFRTLKFKKEKFVSDIDFYFVKCLGPILCTARLPTTGEYKFINLSWILLRLSCWSAFFPSKWAFVKNEPKFCYYLTLNLYYTTPAFLQLFCCISAFFLHTFFKKFVPSQYTVYCIPLKS